MSRCPFVSKAVLFCALLALAAPMAAAQDTENVNPGINESYLAPEIDVDRYVDTFEGESREVYAARHDVVDALDLDDGDRVADIGPGTGFYTRLFAREVGDTGTVYAVDIAPDFLKHINASAEKAGLGNIVAVLGRRKRLTLPEDSIDLAFTSNVYHHFEYPAPMLESIYNALTPGGEFVVIDFKKVPGESPAFVMNHVRADKETVIDEARNAGFVLAEEVSLPGLQDNYFLRFRKE